MKRRKILSLLLAVVMMAGLLPATQAADVTITAGQLLFAKADKAELSLEGYDEALTAWIAPGKKAASYKQAVRE